MTRSAREHKYGGVRRARMDDVEYQHRRFALIESIIECRQKARDLRRVLNLPDVAHPNVPDNEETDPVSRQRRAVEILEDRLWEAEEELAHLQRMHRALVHSRAQ